MLPPILAVADPPYVGSTRSDPGKRLYANEMKGVAQHRELLEAALASKSKVIVSGYDHPLYNEMLGDWERREVEVYAGSANNKPRDGNGGNRVEVIWMNYEPPTS